MTIKIKRQHFITTGLVLMLMVFSFSGCSQAHLDFNPDTLAGLESDSAAHWVHAGVILLPKKGHYVLLKKTKEKIQGIDLKPIERPDDGARQFPHLVKFYAYSVPLEAETIKSWLKHELMVVTLSEENKPLGVSYVQTGGVIDDLYTSTENDADEVDDFGASRGKQHQVQFKLWAPTAQEVAVLGFNRKDLTEAFVALPMKEDRAIGVWHLKTDKIALYDYYQYKIKVYHPQTHGVETLWVTDPYSLSLSTNGTHSQVVDLSAPNTQPNHWDNQRRPALTAPEDQILYETHIRDFSAADTSNIKYKGKYLAFTELESLPMKHLAALKDSGLNTIHLLPAFDFGSVNEDKTQIVDLDDTLQTLCSKHIIASVCQGGFVPQQTIRQLLATFDPRTDAAQKVVSELRKLDNYNWGYDPVHYTVPEGSYATDPMGIPRIIEFRTMVMQLHNLGFRVIMDVVYNHTHQYGLAPHSVLDKIVPGYYHRLDPLSGEVEQSTCFSCGNTATERKMMAKLMEDSLKTWTEQYKIDGFRFDLMGHQPKAVMLKAREAVRKIDPDTYFYGEGWNFGEVANNRRFVQASQLELGGSEIGTFSDRLRDAMRGSGNNTRDTQGLGNGLGTLPNERQASDRIRAQYELATNQVRIGLAGNLSNFELGKLKGKTIPYGNQPTGYAYDPADTINYVSKHDNQTLWDNSQYRLPFDTSTADRVRLHNLSLSYVLYAQGIPFLHMGSELLRSKSFLRDSYDYGDWFNRVDFSKGTNNYNIGLPPADKDAENWPLIKTVLTGHQGRDIPSSQDIQFASKVFEDMLSVRSSTKLFRLQTEQSIMEKLHFLNQNTAQPIQGVIAMEIDDTKGEAVGEEYQKILVIFNNNSHQVDFNYAGAKGFELHHALATGADEVVKNSQINDHGFVVPRLTAAVFVKKS